MTTNDDYSMSDNLYKRYRELVRKYHSDACDFEMSVGYLIQATRNEQRYLKKDESLVVYTTRPETRQFVIVGSVGAEREELIHQTAKKLHKESRKSIIVKNVDPQMEQALLERGFRHYRADEWWDPWFKYDDNTFPEQILDTDKLQKLSGEDFKKLKCELEAFRRKYSYTVERVEMINENQINHLAEIWAKNLNERNFVGEEFIINSVKMFFERNDHLFHFKITNTDTGDLIGMLAFSEISKICLAANLLLNDFSYRKSSRIFMIEGARCAGKLGYKYLNTQGSEDTNQHLAKKLLNPIDQIFKTHLIYEK